MQGLNLLFGQKTEQIYQQTFGLYLYDRVMSSSLYFWGIQYPPQLEINDYLLISKLSFNSTAGKPHGILGQF